MRNLLLVAFASLFLATSCDIQDLFVARYTVTYDANGGSGSVPIDNSSYREGDNVSVRSADTLKKSNYAFKGWSTNSDGIGTLYSEVMTFTMGSSNVTFYAVWISTTQKISMSVSSSSSTLYSFQSDTLSATVNDPNPYSTLSYSWTTSIGSLSSTSGTISDFYLYGGSSSMTVTISCTVKDNYGNAQTASTSVYYIPAGAITIINNLVSSISDVRISGTTSSSWGGNWLGGAIVNSESRLIYGISTDYSYNVKINNSVLVDSAESYAVFAVSSGYNYKITMGVNGWSSAQVQARNLLADAVHPSVAMDAIAPRGSIRALESGDRGYYSISRQEGKGN
jgi:Listeria-Bacteroides repeat domain (List_Bact_rpt).